ncbi:bifunctional diguanylate cyclase/phosphodiesterase [Shewanella psychromarinicola]|uniref:PAS domain S-box protein n=1 Tax=Shewanella psychromarinicola TaxID=2487742 RepID=A0A3N4E4S7_9GAMM|nr:bifunctional diguanylate cyclase/phosphodiesterase [Shewanella psychromarinicola]AZG36158.1 PAS domain S-box protein [Shewanella psychromarinicola]RPA31848.1 PAS domain S-box protein [Shewanella psychromarinicola]
MTTLWLVIIGICLLKRRQLTTLDGSVGGAVAVLLIILGIDAVRTIIESVYLGLYFTSLYGLIPKAINELLSQPSWLIIPQLINVAAGLLVIWLLLKRWLPSKLAEREQTLRALDKAKTASVNNERLFSSISNCVTDGFIFADPERRIISINQGMELLLGYCSDELVGKNVSIIYASNEEYERQGLMYFNLAAGEKLKPYEANYRHKDGGIVVGETSRIMIKDVDGQIQGYMGFIRDVTDRNKTAMKLQANQAALSHHIQNTPLGYISRDINSNCIEINKSAEAIFGYSADEVRGHCLLDLLVPDEGRNDIENVIKSLLKSNKDSISINKNKTKDGRTIICEWHNTPLVSEHGEVIGVTSLIQDVTENRRTQIALEETEKKFREQSQRYAEVIWGANIGTWEWNVQTGKASYNQRWAEMLGYSLKELEPIDNNTWEKRVHPDDIHNTNELLKRCFTNETDTYECEFRMQHKDGSWVWILDRGRVVEWTKDGKAVRMSGLHQDITKSKQSEDARKLAASVFTYAREGIIITDTKGVIIDVNDAFSDITGYELSDVIGQNPRMLKSGLHLPEFYKEMWATLQQKGYWTGEVWNMRKNGEVYPQILTISSVLDDIGVVQNYVALFNDITAIKEHQGQLERIAHYDMLTNLPNRTLLADRLTQSMKHSQRQQSLLVVAFVDLDRFKKINDTYGHIVGDELLIVVSSRMKEALRNEDTLARIGGDEFVAVIENIHTMADCEPILERLLLAASDPVVVGGVRLEVSASIGVSIYPQDDVDADQLIRHADQAMYVAKQQGKNRYRLFDSAHNTAMVNQHGELERIRKALDGNEFLLYYQPKVNMKTGEMIGVEALIRWQCPERGLIGPNEFLPVIEDHVLSIALGEWVIGTALSQIKAWQTLGLNIAVSVNISAIQLQSDDFATRLAELLAAFPEIDPSALELEVLETSAIGDLLQVSETMHACIKLGVNFALDDFGTGYSSLSHLRRLPASLIKIDQTFVCDMLIDSDDLSIVESVVVLGKTFKRDVIAEGVETIAHGVALLQLGCELAQGYGIARPMMAKDVPQWAANWQPDVAWRQFCHPKLVSAN